MKRTRIINENISTTSTIGCIPAIPGLLQNPPVAKSISYLEKDYGALFRTTCVATQITPVLEPTPGDPSPLKDNVMSPIRPISESMWPGVAKYVRNDGGIKLVPGKIPSENIF
jgi:hypothetical protein